MRFGGGGLFKLPLLLFIHSVGSEWDVELWLDDRSGCYPTGSNHIAAERKWWKRFLETRWPWKTDMKSCNNPILRIWYMSFLSNPHGMEKGWVKNVLVTTWLWKKVPLTAHSQINIRASEPRTKTLNPTMANAMFANMKFQHSTQLTPNVKITHF
jgi:hypothetical protein